MIVASILIASAMLALGAGAGALMRAWRAPRARKPAYRTGVFYPRVRPQ